MAEIEDVITDGMGVVRQFPYAHWISFICSMIVPVYRQDEAPRFPVYRPTAPQDRRRGRQAERAAMAQLSLEAQARVAQDDDALLAVEAQLPGGEDEIHWSELESDSSEDVEYFPAAAPASHDHEAPIQRASPRVTRCCYSHRVTGDSAVRAYLSPTTTRHSAERGSNSTGGGQEIP